VETLIFDIETHNADLIYSMEPSEFVRLIGYKWVGQDGVSFTTDVNEIIAQIENADMIIGHNIHSFDLPALYGTDSMWPMHLADAGRIYDTWTHAALCHPAPMIYTDRTGTRRIGLKPGQVAKWNSLDEQAHQLGVPGKTHSLAELAHRYGNPDLKRVDRIRDGFGKIPVSDPDYRDYLAGDVNASEAVARALLQIMPLTPYAMREQRIESRKQVISNNGFRVDLAVARKRAAELASRRGDLVGRLSRDYGFPTAGLKPWVSNAGKAAILAILADHGITPDSRPDWARTATGAPSMGADVITAVTAGTDAASLGSAIAELQGQRVLAQLAIDSTHPDGLVHPRITMLQRSGRWSTTNPGLTVWSERDPIKRLEKSVFVPDDEESSLMEFDYSNADARIVAALSGDTKYAALFADDDGRQFLADLTGEPDYVTRFKSGGMHAINAVLAFGAETVNTDPNGYRQTSKTLGHAWNYGAGARRLAGASGLPLAVTERFDRGLKRSYVKLTRWQDRVRNQAVRHGAVTNPWGRIMRVDRGHEYTQAPALMGQSGTREVICDALLAFPADIMSRVKAQVHDALVINIPTADAGEYATRITKYMETNVNPDGGQSIDFPVSHGHAAPNWADAGH
jgi:DNA polymerase-1